MNVSFMFLINNGSNICDKEVTVCLNVFEVVFRRIYIRINLLSVQGLHYQPEDSSHNVITARRYRCGQHHDTTETRGNWKFDSNTRMLQKFVLYERKHGWF